MNSIFKSLFMLMSSVSITVSVCISCNQNAPKDFEVYNGIMRSELVRMDFKEQNNIYAKMSPENRSALWKYKMQDLLNDGRYSAEEKEEFKRIAAYLKPEVFTEEGRVEFQKVADDWENTMKEKFGWNDEKIVQTMHLFMTTAEQNENLRINNPSRYAFIMTGNPEIDNNIEKWAEEHFEYYSESPRSEFVKLKINQQKAIWSLMPQDKRISMLIYKQDDIKKSTNLNQSEKDILGKYYELLLAEFYAGDNGINNGDKAGFDAYRSLKDLGWTSDRCYNYLDCLMTEDEQRQYCKLYNIPDVL